MITLNFESFPPGPNEHMNYMKKSKITKMWREKAKHNIEGQCLGYVPRYKRVRISAVFSRSRIGIADEDNDRSRLKPIIDGLVDAKLIPNDTRQYIVWSSVKEERGPKGLKIMIEEIGIGCTRCGSITDDVEPFLLNTYFCLKCYSKLVMAFLTGHECDTVEEWLQQWIGKSRNA